MSIQSFSSRARVQKVQAWSPADGPLVLEPVGGGTCHWRVFDWLAICFGLH